MMHVWVLVEVVVDSVGVDIFGALETLSARTMWSSRHQTHEQDAGEGEMKIHHAADVDAVL